MRRRRRSPCRLGIERCEPRLPLAADGLQDIVLSSARVAENLPPGAVVGELSVGGTADVTFKLVTGAGSVDNGRFRVVGSQLQTNAVFNYEARGQFSVRVRANAATGGFVERPLTIRITDVNEPPTGIRLSRQKVEAGLPAGTVVGNLDTLDQDQVAVITIFPPPPIFAYALVPGSGAGANDFFTIARDVETGVDQLQTAAPLPAGTYSIRVRSTDGGGLFVEQALEVHAVAVNRPPAAVALDKVVSSIDEGLVGPRPLKVADIVITDDAQGSNTIRLGGADASRFMVLAGGLCLRPGQRLDFETRPALDVTVTVQDLRLPGSPAVSVTQRFAVRDVDERPTIRPTVSLGSFEVNAPFALGHATLLKALGAVDPEGRPLSLVVQGVISGSLQRLVKSVAPDGAETIGWVTLTADAPVAQRTITPADRFRWVPPLNARGLRPAVRIRAWDGVNESLQAATVNVAVG